MKHNTLSRLRLLAMLEGTSLLLLIVVAVPLKRIYGVEWFSKLMGPIHGLLFILFVMNTLSFAVERAWKFRKITWKILVACFIPFGTFYVDRKILKPLHQKENT